MRTTIYAAVPDDPTSDEEPEPIGWHQKVAWWIGSLWQRSKANEERSQNNRRRIVRLEERDHEIGPSDIPDPPTTFWSWLSETTNSTYRTVAAIVLAIVGALLLIILAASDVSIPFISSWLPIGVFTSVSVHDLAAVWRTRDTEVLRKQMLRGQEGSM